MNVQSQSPAAPSPGGEGSSFAGIQNRSFRLGRIEVEQAPRIDGSLTDECWANAPVVGQLVEVEPTEGKVPDQRTVIRVLHDEDNFYMAIQCFDDPRLVRGTQRQRDANLDPDDRVEWILDPFRQGTVAYWFQIGAGGSRGDALLSQGGNTFNKSWDTIWDGFSKITADGWQAEVVIPFRSLSRRDGSADWGFNVVRRRRAGNKAYRWNNPFQARRFFRFSEAGLMKGIGDVDTGLGLEVRPYTLAAARRVRSEGDSFDGDLDAGGEIYYWLTPQLTLATTFFTDFAETENDSRQINFNRFPLFFPERRDFFLADAGRFEFGPPRQRSLIPFFSRRIGLASGTTIPIIAGAKLTGEVGPWSVGLLNVQTGEEKTDDEDFEGRNLSVARANYAIGEEHSVGMIFTNGRPTEDGQNTVGGLDYYYRNPAWISDLDLRLWAYGLFSSTSGLGGDGNAWGANASATGNEWAFGASTRWITDDFNPELGFLRRSGIKQQFANVDWRPRLQGSFIRRFNIRGSTDFLLDESNELQELEVEFREVGFETQEGDEIALFGGREFERVNTSFDIFDDRVVIDAGDYWQTRGGIRIETGKGRPVSFQIQASYGDLFDGRSLSTSVEVNWRTGPLLIMGAELSRTEGQFDGSDYEALQAEGSFDLHFSNRLSWLNLVQFDNESDNLGFQSRVRWIVQPGSDVFVVASGGWVRQDDDSLVPEEQALVVKVGHTLRF